MTADRIAAAWRALDQEAAAHGAQRIANLFDADPRRAVRHTLEAAGLVLDASRHCLRESALQALMQLAEACGFDARRKALFDGEAVNGTEGRAALHMALRAPPQAGFRALGEPVMPAVHEVLARMERFAAEVIAGTRRGVTGRPLRQVVNLGIGGSDLGPRMICETLPAGPGSPQVHFVANVDAAQLHDVLRALDPAETLLIVTSKTFTTQETLANASNARRWLVAALGEAAVAQHCVAVSTNAAEVARFGIADEGMFGFWDWVGGRYSSWSAVGLSALLHLGPARFRELLAGAWAMDEHFRDAPAGANLPLRLALLSLWNHNLLGHASQVVAPYAQGLERFVAWLQQLEMESNGKSVDRDGRPLRRASTPALWGDVGTNAQHAFFQMLHQGCAVHPVDFILVAQPAHPYVDQHRLLLANALAQSAALMLGKDAATVRAELSARGLSGLALEQAVPHRVFAGNRPSNLLLLPRLDAHHLGALMALYEHRTFALSVLWGVNAFDQWGVELGKQLTQSLLRVLDGAADPATLDPATRVWVERLFPSVGA